MLWNVGEQFFIVFSSELRLRNTEHVLNKSHDGINFGSLQTKLPFFESLSVKRRDWRRGGAEGTDEKQRTWLFVF